MVSKAISTKAMFLRAIFKSDYASTYDQHTDAMGYFIADYPVINDSERLTDDEFDYIIAPVEEDK